MIELACRYGPIVRGIDWLGAAIEGQPIPPGYFKDLDVKLLERALADDPSFDHPELRQLHLQKRELLTVATAATANDVQYDALNRTYYRRLAEHLQGTPYQLISDFYQMRDAHIAANAVQLVKSNPGGRVVIVVGADHRSAVIDEIEASSADRVILEIV